MPLTTDCTITGTWPQVDGVPATGHVIVEPVESVASGGYMIVDVPITVQLVAGSISKLFTSAAGVQLRITERIRGARVNEEPYVVTPISGTLNLATAPRGTGDVVPTYIPGSAIGQPGGVAGLDGAGKVPLAQLPAGATGVVDVTAADGTIVVGGDGQHPTVKVGEIGQAAVTGLPGALTALGSAASAASAAAGTAQTTANAAVPKATASAKGDLLAATGPAAVVRVPVGSDGQVLVADAASAPGVKWAAPIGGSTLVVRQAYINDLGRINLPNTAAVWVPLPDFPLLPIPAAVGDYIDVTLTALKSLPATAIDLAVLVDGALVRFMSSGSNTPGFDGDHGWEVAGGDKQFLGRPSSRGFTVESGDLDSGEVVICVAVKSDGSGTIDATPDYPFYWRAMNYGEVS